MVEISVVVPVYNVEQFVKKCIDSILKQTFADIEVILVDDGSKDNSGVICDDYMKLDKRIRVIHQKHMGPSVARNRGVQEAEGEYICFVDSDDYIVPEFCEIMYKLLKNSKNDFCVCRYERFNNDRELVNKKNITVEEYRISNYEYFEEQLVSGFSACAKLYKKEIFSKNQFIVGRIHEDMIWGVDLAKNLHNGVCFTEAKLYYYRQNDTGIMASSAKRCSPDRVFAGRYLVNTVKDIFPELLPKALKYGIMYPWSYVDGIFVHRTFKENMDFLKDLQQFLKENRILLKKNEIDETKIIRQRMLVFSYSLFLYGCNAYARLVRLYVCKIIHKDAYKSGHGI